MRATLARTRRRCSSHSWRAWPVTLVRALSPVLRRRSNDAHLARLHGEMRRKKGNRSLSYGIGEVEKRSTSPRLMDTGFAPAACACGESEVVEEAMPVPSAQYPCH